MTNSDIDKEAIAIIKGLAMDAPHKARSGHQGTAMSLAPLAHVLWSRVMSYDPAAPDWPNRDRLILSAGHASILLYSMLHLTGYDVSLDDLKNFRQWSSPTPGHPEYGCLPGVEVTTGPLGQGIANGVGMAIAERNLRSRFGSDLCDHYTWVICGDGDLSEGISHESASLAGHLGLGRLTLIYDDNHITIDGETEISLSDNTAERFLAYGWHVIELKELSNDLDSIESSLLETKEYGEQPSLVILRTHIGDPSPHIDTPAVHGYSLKDEEIKITKKKLDLPEDKTFYISQNVKDFYLSSGRRSSESRKIWEQKKSEPSEINQLWDVINTSGLIDGWETAFPTWSEGDLVATRKASNQCIESLTEFMPGLVGGGADLTGNTGTSIANKGVQSKETPEGRQIFFGVREHAMGGISNGIALHGGLFPVTGTFLVFSDYMRGAVRLAALSEAKGVFVWSHDSVAVGEDGPTHQPVEHIASLRSIPKLDVFRPADANETSSAWKLAITHNGPTALLLTRQDTPVLPGTLDLLPVSKGAYIIYESQAQPDLILIATGSEVAVALEAAKILVTSNGINIRVVSMPCMERFERESENYQNSIITPGVPSLSIEAASTFGWAKWADQTIGIDQFGASAPGEIVLEKLGISPDNVVEKAKSLLNLNEASS